jgi:hypothetical protein
MSLNAGLTTIHEDDITKHQVTAQSLVTKLVILESEDGKSGTRRHRPAFRLHRLDRRHKTHA